jgi:putative ABC transport system substrate-binding protein
VKRREFIAVFGSAMIAGPVAAQGRPAKIGMLVLGNPDPAPFLKEFKESLRELGYIEGQNIQFEIRSADRQPANLAPLAAELVALKVDVLVAFQTPAATAAKQATQDIPIFMAGVGDPVGTGLVASLARPGGNITGVTGAAAELGAKNVELIREVFPSTRRLAFLVNANDPLHKPLLEYILGAAKTLSMEVKPILVKSAEQLESDFVDIEKWRAEAVIVQPSLPNRQIADLAIKHRLPAIAPHSSFTAAGGLMSYSADFDELYRQGAAVVDKILKGRKPADLPVEMATKFRLIFNLKTAKAIGITVPASMLARADQVIE